MKCILFDVDTDALLSKDNSARPFMDIILRFCGYNKVTVVFIGNNNRCGYIRDQYNSSWYQNLFLLHKKGDVVPIPTLAFSCDADYLKKWPASILIPPYVPERSNEFMELAFAGHLLDTIKNRVVLGRQAVVEKVEQPRPPELSNKEDFSNWAFEV